MIDRRVEILLLLVLAVVALATRLYHPWEAPYLGFVDIGSHANIVLRLRDIRFAPPWALAWGPAPYFYHYTLLPFFYLFEPPLIAQKVAVLTFSLFALGFTYAFLRDLGGNLFALLATGVLVFSRYFLFYSRYPMEPVEYFFFAAALFTFRRAILNRRPWHSMGLLLVSALLVAAAQHIYLSARLLLPMFAAYFLILWPRQPDRVRAFWQGTLFAALLVLLLLPLAYEYYTHPRAFFLRHEEIGLMGNRSAAAIARNHLEAFLSFVNRADGMRNQNLTGVCMTNPGIAALLLIGMASGLLLIRHEAVQLGFAVVLLALPASGLTVEPYNSKRLMNALLGVSIFAAYPAAYVLGRWHQRFRVAAVVPLGVALVLVWFGVRDFRILFVDFAGNAATAEYSGYLQTRYALEVVKAGRTKDIAISSARMFPQARSYHPYTKLMRYDAVDSIPIGEPVFRDVAILVEGEDRHLLPVLRSFYPQAVAFRKRLSRERGLMRYDIPAADVNAALGVQVEIEGRGEIRRFAKRWDDADLQIRSEEPARVIRLSGLMYSEKERNLTLEGRGSYEWVLDGETIASERIEGVRALTGPRLLRGWMPWSLTFRPDGESVLKLSRIPGQTRVVWKGPPEGALRQIIFSDSEGRLPLSVAYVPQPFYYDQWGARPRAFTLYCADVTVPSAGSYDLHFLAEGRARLRFDRKLDEKIIPRRSLRRSLQLEAGVYPVLFGVDMSPNSPRVKLDLVAEGSTPPNSADIRWRPCARPLPELLTEAQQLAGTMR